MNTFLKVASIIFGIVLLAIGTRQIQAKIFYESVVKIEGEYAGIRKNNLRQGRTELKITLKGHNSEYTIQDFIKSSFDKEAFTKEVEIGQLLSIHLDEKESKMIAQIISNGKEYMSTDTRNSNRKLNGIFALIGGVIFIIIGIRIKN